MNPSDEARELPEREQIRVIWRPLYELGVKGQEQIDAEYMAHIVPVAVNETQKLIATKQLEARKQAMADFTALVPDKDSRLFPGIDRMIEQPDAPIRETCYQEGWNAFRAEMLKAIKEGE